MTPKQMVILNYGLMLNDMHLGMQDHITIISRIIRENNLQNDPDLVRISNTVFKNLCQSMKDMDKVCEKLMKGA